MPILTLGGMRQQLTWAPKADLTLADINKECHDNFAAILDRAMQLGINHIETARAYGTSEMQYGALLSKYPRDSYILQTKGAPKENCDEFVAILEKSFAELQLGIDGFVDLFSFHGINRPEHLEWILRPGGCMSVVREWQKSGRIRFVGFSTHGMAPLIVQVNLFHKFSAKLS
jgi:predicted aldo/keto reductase-like oxidoreductase